MSDQFFEELEGKAYSRPKSPIWTMDLDDKENEQDLLKWLVGELGYLKEMNRERFEIIRRNLSLYRGIQYRSQETRTELRERAEEKSRAVERIVVNHLRDLTQQKVSTLIKYKPAVAILPSNDEFGDRVAAKMCDYLLSHIWYENNFEGQVVPEWVRNSRICGEDLLFIEWDPDKGDLHPEWKRAELKGNKIPLLGSDGKPQKDDKGNPIFLDRPVKVGDVKYDLTLALDVLAQRKPSSYKWSDVEYIFKRKVMHVEEARALWPKKAAEIKAQSDLQQYNYESMILEPTENMVTVWYFYHKSIPMMNQGRQIIFTPDVVLSNKKLGYSHGKIPCVPLVNVKRPGELHAASFFQDVTPVTGAYNNLTNMILKNQILVGHPKWMLPSGAAKLESLGNDITVVQFKGPVAPSLMQANPTGREIFEFRKELKEEFQQLAGVFGVSRGEPPPGIKAGVALQFLDEQEQNRSNEDVLVFNEAIKEVAEMTLSVAGDYYESSDERMIRVIGKENAYMSVFFDAANLSKDYDVRIQNSSALPQSKAARTQSLLDLSERFPEQVTGEQVLDMLDLAQSQKFIDSSTVATRAAEAENELLLQGKEVIEPQEYEHHIKHWKVHTRAAQDFSFKNLTPPEIQAMMFDHIIAHEMLMVELAKKNQKFSMELAELDLFPMFYKPEMGPELVGPPHPEEQAMGMASEVPYGEQGLPVGIPSPESQEDIAPPMETMDQQMAGENVVPEMGPIPPTSGI